MTNLPSDLDIWFESQFHDAFDALYRHVYGLCRTYNRSLVQEVEDVVQDTFALLWRERQKLIDHPNLRGWLYLTATNKFSNRMSKAGRRYKREYTFDEAIDSEDDWDAEAILQDQMAWLIETVGQESYDLLLLYYDKRISNDELARKLGITPTTLRSRIYRIIQPLRTKNFIVFLVLLRNISHT